MELVRTISDSIKIEVSTILHIDTVTQIKYLNDRWGISRICCGLLKNRDFRFLKAAAKYCKESGVELELIVNEFCGISGENYATHCLFRDSCYITHSTNLSDSDIQLYNNYPQNNCISDSDENILKLPFIRPEDIHNYVSLGIEHFKITGRSGPTSFLKKISNAYLSGKYEGNLLDLWKPLNSTHQLFIDNSKLNGFLDYWCKNPDFDCSKEICGETCQYCNKYLKHIMS